MSRLLWGAWLAAAAATTALAFTEADTVLRPAVTWLFLAFGPGWALVGGLRSADLLTRLALALGLSIAIDVIAAQAMLMAGAWSPRTGLLAVLAVSGLGLVLHARRAVKLRRTWRPAGEVLPSAKGGHP